MVEHVRQRHRGDLDGTDRAGEVVGVTGHEFGAERSAELVERGLAERRFLGDRPHRVVEFDAGEGLVQRIDHRRVDPVDDDRCNRIVSERVAADHDALDDLGGGAAMSVDDRHDRQAEVFGDSGVDLQLDRRGRPGEVGPLDDDEVAGRFDLLESLDDAFHARTVRRADVGAFGSGERVADALVGHLVTGPDQLEVVVGEPLDDRTVEAHLRHPPRQQLDEPEGDDRLATRRPHRRQIDRPCHAVDRSRGTSCRFCAPSRPEMFGDDVDNRTREPNQVASSESSTSASERDAGGSPASAMRAAISCSARLAGAGTPCSRPSRTISPVS